MADQNNSAGAALEQQKNSTKRLQRNRNRLLWRIMRDSAASQIIKTNKNERHASAIELKKMPMPKNAKSKPLKPKRIFLVEDHPTFREGLAQILNKEHDLTICGAAGTAAKAMQVIARLKPDLALVDISLPGKSGLEMIKEIRRVNRKIKLLVLSMHDEALYADRVLRAGGDGYIMKEEDTEEIVQAIRDVLDGRVYVSEEVFARSSNGTQKRSAENKTRAFDQLGDLELEILECIGRGKSDGEIAKQLRIGSRKIKSLRAQMEKKLKVKGADALVRFAVCWVETGKT